MSLKVQYLGLRTPVYPTQVSMSPGKGAQRFFKACLYSFLTVLIVNYMVPGGPTWFWISVICGPLGAIFFCFEDEGKSWSGKWWPTLSAVTAGVLHFCQFMDD